MFLPEQKIVQKNYNDVYILQKVFFWKKKTLSYITIDVVEYKINALVLRIAKLKNITVNI